MTIKHLVLSGGGPTGFLTYGIVSKLEKKNFWKLADIKSIYGCSIGAYIGLVVLLGFEWEWIDDYFIKRPWEKLITESKVPLIDIYAKKCLLNSNFYTEAIMPLLKAKDLKENITLLELYEFTKIDFHMYTTNINTDRLLKIDLSYKTHPDLSLIKALRMTMAFPVGFEPIIENENCYVDGGLLNNFPLNDCIKQQACEKDEILALKNIWKENTTKVTDESSMFDYLICLLKKMQASVDSEPEQEEVKYTVHCQIEDAADFNKWVESLTNESARKKLIDNGQDQADFFLAYNKIV